MTRVLVPGGAGLIGSHLAERLVRDGFEEGLRTTCEWFLGRQHVAAGEPDGRPPGA